MMRSAKVPSDRMVNAISASRARADCDVRREDDFVARRHTDAHHKRSKRTERPVGLLRAPIHAHRFELAPAVLTGPLKVEDARPV
jgi:hypothetical protein